MGGSRRRLKKSRAKVKVGLPKKNPNVFKPAFNFPPKLRSLITNSSSIKWDDKASVLQNYKSFGVVANPNFLGSRSHTPNIVLSESLQVPPTETIKAESEFEVMDTGSDLEEDDLKSALGKKRRDGKTAPAKPLTAMQRVHIGRLIEKYGDNYQSMFMDTKLNAMQHSVATLEKLCKRFYVSKSKNPLILSR
ncbi:hypothetical protein GIB67_015088 [Kingdonia uniflora]|uniref:Nucleolar protein 16 n=1 Tax=Kingdonia uniflora TaxID=39325 RepID=A0A7J7LJ82_9MAGN|nr:hypothetical protein GIB67_015088 [Kingdonia uniflora]